MVAEKRQAVELACFLVTISDSSIKKKHRQGVPIFSSVRFFYELLVSFIATKLETVNHSSVKIKLITFFCQWTVLIF